MGHSAATPPTGPDGPLARLAAERATGALRFPGGRIRLRDGAVSWVECDDLPGTAAPGGPAREGGRPRRTRQGRAARGASGDDRAPGPDAGDTAPESLALRQIRHLTLLLDAAFLVLPLPAEGTSFTPGAEHCPAAVRQVGVAALLRAVAVRRAQLDAWRTWAAVDGAPVVLAPDARREDGPGWRARLLLGAADGRRTPAELARALGHSVFWTLLEVRRLAAGGLVTLPEGAAETGGTRTGGGAGVTGPAADDGTETADPAAPTSAAASGRKTGGGTGTTGAAGGRKAGRGTAASGGRKTAGGAAAGGTEGAGAARDTGPEASGGRSASRGGGTRPGGTGRPRGGEKRSGTAGRERSGTEKRPGAAPSPPSRPAAGGREGGLPTRTPAGGRSGGPSSRAAGRERDAERPAHSAADDGGAPGGLPRRRPGVCLEEARERDPQPAGAPALPPGLPETADPDVTLLTRLRTALEENL